LAAKTGATLEDYAKLVLEREAHGSQLVAQGGALESAEFEQCLDELAEGLPPLPILPADFSRADIYGEHT
jgi:hypothetical protein